MVREAVIIELTNSTGFPMRYTCASGTAITKGTLLAFTDPRTASAHASADQPFAGVAAMDKASDDYSTSISAITDGVIDVYASGAITVGAGVQLASPANYVKTCLSTTTVASGAVLLGYALETATDGEVINVRIRT